MFDIDQSEIGPVLCTDLARKCSVNSDIKPQVRRQFVVFVQLPMTLAMKHDAAIRFVIPCEHSIVAHREPECLIQERTSGLLDSYIKYLVYRREVIVTGTDASIMIPCHQMLPPGQLFMQMTGVFSFQKRQVSENVDIIPLVNAASRCIGDNCQNTRPLAFNQYKWCFVSV